MVLSEEVEIRPRTAGEVLDDAWRIYLAHGPALLVLSGLFSVPAAVALLLLLAGPGSLRPTWLLPAVAAVLMPLSGLGAGACQEALRRFAVGKALDLAPCLAGGLRTGLGHVAIQGTTMAAAAPGLVLLGWTALAATREGLAFHLLLLALAALCWIGLVLGTMSDLHPFLAAGERNVGSIWNSIGRTVQLHPGKAAVVAFSRLALQLFAALNVHVLIQAVLWVAQNLAGLDTVLAGVLVSLSNPVYLIALVLLTWLLVAPWSSAADYLLHVDLRARVEGLDLWYRVQRHFPTGNRRKAIGASLALASGLLLVAHAPAAEKRLEVVREARQEIDRISAEVKTTEPYPGGRRWLPRLSTVVQRLDQSAGAGESRFLWVERAIESFSDRSRDGAIEVLADLDRRLALVEESLTLPRQQPGQGNSGRIAKDDIKRLLPQPSDSPDSQDLAADSSQSAPDARQPILTDDEDGGLRRNQRGPGWVGPNLSGGLGVVGWMVLAGLLLAVLAAASVMYLRSRRPARSQADPKTGSLALSPEAILTSPTPNANDLWRRAEDLARDGLFLEAIRMLYLLVLVQLHRANLIRCERTRTNGEYLQQLRRATGAPATLFQPFRSLVFTFEEKWYGNRACAAEDYRDYRELVTQIRDRVRSS